MPSEDLKKSADNARYFKIFKIFLNEMYFLYGPSCVLYTDDAHAS